MSTTDTHTGRGEIDGVFAEHAPPTPTLKEEASTQDQAIAGAPALDFEPKIGTGRAAAILGVTHTTVAALVDRGALRCIWTPTGNRRVYEADVRALLEASPGSQEPTLAISKAAAFLGVSVSTLNRWAREGRLESVPTVTGQHQFREADVRALLDTQEADGPTISTEEAAATLGVKPTTISRWAREGRLSPVPAISSAQHRFREAEVRALLGGQEDVGSTLSKDEVAAALGVKPSTISKWVRQGTLTPIHAPTGRHRFRESDVRALAERRAPR